MTAANRTVALRLTHEQLEKFDRRFVMILSLWFVSVAVAAWFGLYTLLPVRIAVMPIGISVVIPVVIYFRSRAFQQYIASISLKHLTLFHLWRIPAGITFLYYGQQELLPEIFVRNAGYGDIAVGVLVPIVLATRHRPWKFAAFHIIGVLDLAVAVGTGVTFALSEVPLMNNIVAFPIVLIPMYGVAVTGSLGIMTLHRIAVSKAT